jgi:hypothetical protein
MLCEIEAEILNDLDNASHYVSFILKGQNI